MDKFTELVKQARELLEPFGDVRHFDVLVPTALLAALADAVEQERDAARARVEKLREKLELKNLELVHLDEMRQRDNQMLIDKRNEARAEVARLTDGIRETIKVCDAKGYPNVGWLLWSLLDVAGEDSPPWRNNGCPYGFGFDDCCHDPSECGDDSLGDRLAAKHGIGEKPDAREHIDFVTGKRVAGDDKLVPYRALEGSEGGEGD